MSSAESRHKVDLKHAVDEECLAIVARVQAAPDVQVDSDFLVGNFTKRRVMELHWTWLVLNKNAAQFSVQPNLRAASSPRGECVDV